MNLFHFIFRRVYIRFDYLCLIFETLNIKITTLMLQKTFLARCDNRACLAKTNIMSGSPEAWLSNDILSKSNTFGLTFDFFVDWAINQISPYVWIKRILLPNYTYDEFIGKLDFEMEKEFGKDYLCRLGRFATEYDMQIQFIVFHDDLDWSNDRNELLIVSLSFKEGCYSFSPQKYSLSGFKELIKSHSGGPVSIGSKGLIYGTSRLECSLSKTDSLYPGDADLLLLNEDNKAVCILELKKHTLSSPISEQCFTNYYPRPDGRKYKRLALLRDFLASKSNSRILFFVLYYPTQTYIEQQWILEVIEGNAFSLRATDSFIFELPADKSDNEYLTLIKASSMKHKVLLILLLGIIISVSASAQKVTMNLKQVKLEKVFSAITQQTGLTVAYSRTIVNSDRIVTVEAKNQELSKVLNDLFLGTNVNYEIGKTKIYLKEKVTDFEQQTSNANKKNISGRVVDEKGEPIIGASVMVQGSSLGTITNVDGRYTLANVPESSTITVSYIGYITVNYAATSRNLSQVVLREDSKTLEEVVVVGFGTQ